MSPKIIFCSYVSARPSPSSSISTGGSEDGLDIGAIALAGERCVDKVKNVHFDLHLKCNTHHLFSKHEELQNSIFLKWK